jgi:hypothetical protein
MPDENELTVGVEDRISGRGLHKPDAVLTIAAVDITLATASNCRSVPSIVDPVPEPLGVLSLDVTRVGNINHDRLHRC